MNKVVAIAVLLLGGWLASRAAAADVGAGAKLFADRCAGCHGADGTGGGMGIRFLAFVRGADRPLDFSDASAMSGWSDDRLALTIAKGGRAVGRSGLMPAYGAELSRDQIADLVAYVRSLARRDPRPR
jgi:cytochrome c oxidase cbb3-type subunit 3